MSTTVSSQSPPLATSEGEDLYGEIGALCQLVRLGQGRFTLALIEYDLPRARAKVISDIREQFSALNIVEAALSPPPSDAPPSYNVLDQVKHVVQSTSSDKPPDALILTGLEILFPSLILTDNGHISDELRRALQPLNLGRNILAKLFPCPVLLFLPRAAMEILLTSAPDIVSWKSGFFIFESDLKKVQAELDRESGIKVGWLARQQLRQLTFDELAREIKWLDSLIADARMLPSDPLTIARLHNRLGWAAVALGDSTMAQQSFAEMLRLARCEYDTKLIKVAEKGLRHSEELRRQWRNSLKHSVSMQQSFRGAAALTKADSLFGREAELQELLLQVNRVGNRFVTVWGETGCGKTSIVLAGVVPELEKQSLLPIVIREWDQPALALRHVLERECSVSLSSADSVQDWLQAAVRNTNKTIVVVFDQFEQFFTKHPQRQEREPILKEVGVCLNDFRLPCKFIFILREDYLGRMVELEKFVADALDKNKRFYLSLFDQATALRVMCQLADKAKLNWPDIFLKEVIKDLTEDGQVRPIELQLVGAALATLNLNDEQVYSRAGRAEGLLTDYLQATLESVSVNRRELQDMKRVLLALIEELHERLLLTAEEIAFRSEVSLGSVRDKLNKLTAVSLVNYHAELEEAQTKDDTTVFLYELMHDVLVDSVLRLTRDIQDKRRQAKKILTRALEDVRVKPRHTISLRERRLVLNHLPGNKIKDEPKVKALLRRSLLWGIAKWISLGLLAPLAVLFFVQSTFTHVTIEQDFNDRIVIRRGLPQLGFLPLIGDDLLIDTGFTVKNLAPEKRSNVQWIYFWELDNRRSGAITEKQFYESVASQVEQSKLLIKLGRKDEGLAKLLMILKENKDKIARGTVIEALTNIFNTDSTLAKPAFDVLLPILRETKGIKEDADGISDTHAAAKVLAAAITADPSLAKPALDLLPIDTSLSGKRSKFNGTMYTERVSIMTAAIKADPKLAKPSIDVLVIAFNNDKADISGDIDSALTAVVEADPSLARPVFDKLLTALKEDRERLPFVLARGNVLAAIVEGDSSLAKPVFDILFMAFKEDRERFTYAMASGNALAAVVKADPSLGKPFFDTLLTALKKESELSYRDNLDENLLPIIRENPSLAKPTLDTLIPLIKGDKNYRFAEFLAETVEAAPIIAKPAFVELNPLFSTYEQGRGSGVIWKAGMVQSAVIRAEPSLARPAFDTALDVLKKGNDSYDRGGALDVIAAAIKVDPSLAKPTLDTLLSILNRGYDQSTESSMFDVIAVAIKADPSLTKSVFDRLLSDLTTLSALTEDQGGGERNHNFRSRAANILGICIVTDAEARNKALPLFTGYDSYIREGVASGLAKYLMILASEEAKKGRDPVQFLFDHLEGRQSLLPNGNANTYAAYRQAVQEAMSRWITSKKPETVATQAALKQRLEMMRDRETRRHIRIAAWDTLAAAAELREKQESSTSEDSNE